MRSGTPPGKPESDLATRGLKGYFRDRGYQRPMTTMREMALHTAQVAVNGQKKVKFALVGS